MASGKKNRVMVACVTFETSKVTEPVRFYEADRVHIIHYVKNPRDTKNSVYSDFYERVCELIKEDNPRPVEVIEHNERVSDFTVMLRTVLSIIREEKDCQGECEVFVNISSGSSEYSAAAAIAAMMNPGTTPFSVSTKEYTIRDEEELRRAYYIDGKPVGLTKSVYPPKKLPSYYIKKPEEHLISGLRILDERNLNKQSVTGPNMVAALKESGIWFRETELNDPSKRMKQRMSEAVYYQRDFVNRWVQKGWAVKDELRKRYVVTEEGRIVLDTFYMD